MAFVAAFAERTFSITEYLSSVPLLTKEGDVVRFILFLTLGFIYVGSQKYSYGRR